MGTRRGLEEGAAAARFSQELASASALRDRRNALLVKVHHDLAGARHEVDELEKLLAETREQMALIEFNPAEMEQYMSLRFFADDVEESINWFRDSVAELTQALADLEGQAGA